MKKIVSFLLFIWFVNLSFSQDYGVVGTQWTYNGYDSGTNFKSGYQVVKTEKDTLFFGKMTHKITWTDYDQIHPPQFRGRGVYEYESGDTVFQYNNQTNNFEIKLIFNLNLGDTVSLFYSDGYSSVNYYIDSVFMIQIDSLNLKKYELKKVDIGAPQKITIIDRIGFKDFFNFNQGGPLGGPVYYNLRCYSDTLCDTNFNDFPCDFVSYNSLNENSLNSNITLSPNPAQNILNIESKELEIINYKIFDIQGKEIAFEANTYSQIDVSNFKQGIYLLKIHTKSGIIVKKWVKE